VDGSVPTGWVTMMKQSIADLAWRFSTARMVRDYATKGYLPADQRYRTMHVNDRAAAVDSLAWRQRVNSAWPSVKIIRVEDDAAVANAVGRDITVHATIDLGGLNPEDVSVEAIIGKVGSTRDLYREGVIVLSPVESAGTGVKYAASFRLSHPGNQGYTVRIRPSREGVPVAHELPLVRWESS
jgi:starch phosphorylase